VDVVIPGKRSAPFTGMTEEVAFIRGSNDLIIFVSALICVNLRADQM
jgi:hypothetical protein